MNYDKIIRETRKNLFNYSGEKQEKASILIREAKKMKGIKTRIIKNTCPYVKNPYLIPLNHYNG